MAGDTSRSMPILPSSCYCCSEHSLHNAHTSLVCTSDWCQQPKSLLLSIPRLSVDWKDTLSFYALSPYIFSAMYYRSSMTDCLYISLPVHPSVVYLSYLRSHWHYGVPDDTLRYIYRQDDARVWWCHLGYHVRGSGYYSWRYSYHLRSNPSVIR